MGEQEKLKDTMAKWTDAVTAHNARKYDVALEKYAEIREISARMFYNMACAYIALHDAEGAIQFLSKAVEKDKHLAIAFFQRGTLHLQTRKENCAIHDLEAAKILLRGNNFIDYKQLGLLCRLYSYQIAHNLAVANAHAGRKTEACRLLTEALHGADDCQRKSLLIALQRIEDGRADMVIHLMVTTTRIFSPPKSVMENLGKRDIVRKAKVVTAADCNDQNPGFDGIKRVDELQRSPQIYSKYPKSPLAAVRRFMKVQQPKDQKKSEPRVNKRNHGMKMCKSMSDLRQEDNFQSSPTDTKVNLSSFLPIKRLFQKRNSDDVNALKVVDIQCSQSTGDLTNTKSPVLKRFPRSPMTGVRKLLHNKQKSKSIDYVSEDQVVPVLTMRGARSSSSDNFSSGDDTSLRHRSASENSLFDQGQDQRSYERLKRRSLGSTFGDYSTVVGRTLSLSCDVLTSIATPIEDEMYVNGPFDDEVFDTNAHFYINTGNEPMPDSKHNDDVITDIKDAVITDSNDANKTSVSEGYLKPAYVNYDSENSGYSRKECTPAKHALQTSKAGLSSMLNKVPKKTRPPPPSYPPPPLPPHIVITSSS